MLDIGYSILDDLHVLTSQNVIEYQVSKIEYHDRKSGVDLSGTKNKDQDMENFRYLEGVTTLQLNSEACVGCGVCELVCPHGVFQMNAKKAEIGDLDGCMECGACALNCAAGAIRVTPGVGCASYIIQTWIKGKETASCCGT